MPPPTECVERVKEMVAEVEREKAELVERLNAMHQQIAAEQDPVTKVLRKVEWMEEKERSVATLNKIVASLHLVLEGSLEADDLRGGLSTAASFETSDNDNITIIKSASVEPPYASTAPPADRPFNRTISRSVFQKRTSSMYCLFNMKELIRVASVEKPAEPTLISSFMLKRQKFFKDGSSRFKVKSADVAASNAAAFEVASAGKDVAPAEKVDDMAPRRRWEARANSIASEESERGRSKSSELHGQKGSLFDMPAGRSSGAESPGRRGSDWSVSSGPLEAMSRLRVGASPSVPPLSAASSREASTPGVASWPRLERNKSSNPGPIRRSLRRMSAMVFGKVPPATRRTIYPVSALD